MYTRRSTSLPSATLLTLFSFLTTLSYAQVTYVSAPPPTTTDAGNYAEPTSSPSFANYYFVLIGILIILLCLGYFTLRRTRKRAHARRAAVAASGVSIDTGTAGRGWWRNRAVAEPRREEGLNERGEAPPPYGTGELVEPSQGVELRDLGGKPPDYEGVGGVGGLGDLMRPAPTYPTHGRFA
jgi:hypothetical protein